MTPIHAMTPRTANVDEPVRPMDGLNDPKLARQIESVVRRVCAKAGRPELVEDATQEAWLACAEVIDRYDATTGVPLMGFLRPRVYWAALHFCRDNSGAFSIPERMWRNRHLDGEDDLAAAIYTKSLHYDENSDDDANFDRLAQLPDGDRAFGVYSGHVTRDAAVWDELEREQLHEFISRLEPNERNVVTKFGEGFGCADIARDIGVSRQRVHQVLRRAFGKIRLWWDAPTAA